MAPHGDFCLLPYLSLGKACGTATGGTGALGLAEGTKLLLCMVPFVTSTFSLSWPSPESIQIVPWLLLLLSLLVEMKPFLVLLQGFPVGKPL